jgi:hypothetical protein
MYKQKQTNKLHGPSPRANYTDTFHKAAKDEAELGLCVQTSNLCWLPTMALQLL